MDDKYDKFIWFSIGVKTVIAVILLIMTRYISGAADWYTSHIYPVFVGTVGRAAGWLPFSLSEVLLYILILTVLVQCAKAGRQLCRKELSWKEAGRRSLRRGLPFASTLFLIYMATCGANYYNTSFAEYYGMHTEGYETDQLISLIEYLTDEVNAYADEVGRDEEGLTKLPADINALAVEAMRGISEQYEVLEGYYPRPKALIVSEILSYQSLTGIYSPFTVEANYNGDIMGYNIPFTACHELSHLSGFMREDEANFIAYLACTASDNEVFQYGGKLVAWIHSMNALYKIDPELHAEFYTKLKAGVLEDLRANATFWKEYQGKISDVADKINDTYLKANKQEHGVQSYGRMVNLLIYHYLEEYQ